MATRVRTWSCTCEYTSTPILAELSKAGAGTAQHLTWDMTSAWASDQGSAISSYVSPHAGRTPFGEHARLWMASWNTEGTMSARDESIMRVHVLKPWESWPLSKIDHLAIQTWITGLSQRLSPATVAECRRLTAAVLRSAVRHRLIAYNPCDDIRVPKRRKQDTDEQVIARDVFRHKLLPAVPDRYRGPVAIAGGAGLRWERRPDSAPTPWTWTPAGYG